jgi:hypothetical protein
VQAVNYSEANYLVGRWDGNVFRVPNTDFYPFVQQLKGIYSVSLGIKSPLNANSNLAVKGYFAADSNTAANFYIQDGVNSVPYTLRAGTQVYVGTTQPFLLTEKDFLGREVFILEPTYTIAADNSLPLERVRFTEAGEENAYAFLTTRNIADTFGFVGWRIPVADPTSPYLLNDQNRLLTNVTVNFVQRVSATKTKLKIAIRNYGTRDSMINYVLVSGLPAGTSSTLYVSPANTCRFANSDLTALKCLVDFIPAKSFAKFSVVLTQRILAPLSLRAFGDNFTPRDVVARVVMNTRTRAPRRPSISPSPGP